MEIKVDDLYCKISDLRKDVKNSHSYLFKKFDSFVGGTSTEFSPIVLKNKTSNTTYSHVSMFEPTGKFLFERTNREEMLENYCLNLLINKEFRCGLAEKPTNYIPILIDVDIKVIYDKESKTHLSKEIAHRLKINGDKIEGHLYSEKEVKKIFKIYHEVMGEILEDKKAENYYTFFLEKDAYFKKPNEISSGFHGIILYTVLRKDEIAIHLAPRVKEAVKNSDMFKYLDIEDSSHCVDTASNFNTWLMYGSRKEPHLDYYRLKKIYDLNMDVISIEKAFDKFVLYDSLGEVFIKECKLCGDNYKKYYAIEKQSEEESKTSVFDPALLSKEDLILYYLPRFLSISHFKRDFTKTKKSLMCPIVNTFKSVNEKHIISDENIPLQGVGLEMVNSLMSMLNIERANNYAEWLEIGIILYNIGSGCRQTYDIWIKFSRRTTLENYFSESVCADQWTKFIKRGKGMGTLRFLARTDNPIEYNKWAGEQSVKKASSAITGGHYDLAKMLYEHHGGTYVYTSGKKPGWYQFDGNRWKKMEEGIILKQKISLDLVPKFKEIIKELRRRGDDDEEENSKEIQAKIKMVYKLIGNLNSSPFKKNILEECKEVFYREAFISKLNTDPYLLGFDNGILDLREMRFRKGRPEDMISKSCGYDFPIDMSYDHPDSIEVLDFFKKIFPDPQLERYMWEYCASLLIGGNAAKNILSLIGDGDNGKSMLILMIEEALGTGELGYAIKLPTSVITGKRTQSAAASPEMARSDGVRFMSVQEPSDKESANIGILKELSGNDRLYVRPLYEDGREIVPMFKFCVICNKLLKIFSTDKAFWKRQRVVPCEATFMDADDKGLPKDPREQINQKKFPANPYFKDNITSMKQAFIWIMFQKLKNVKKNGRMPDPEKVKEATLEYKKSNDVVGRFFDYAIKEDEKAETSLTDFYVSFRSWFADEMPPRTSIMIKQEFKEELIKKIGKPSGQGNIFIGFKIKSLKENIKEGNAMNLMADEEEENISVLHK